MKNFREQRDRDGNLKYMYRTKEIGKAVEITLTYQKGGMTRHRGIRIHCTFVTIAPAYPGAHFHTCTYELLDSCSSHVYTLPKRSDRAVTNTAYWFDQQVPGIAAVWETRGKEATETLLDILIREFRDLTHLVPRPATPAAVAVDSLH